MSEKEEIPIQNPLLNSELKGISHFIFEIKNINKNTSIHSKNSNENDLLFKKKKIRYTHTITQNKIFYLIMEEFNKNSTLLYL